MEGESIHDCYGVWLSWRIYRYGGLAVGSTLTNMNQAMWEEFCYMIIHSALLALICKFVV